MERYMNNVELIAMTKEPYMELIKQLLERCNDLDNLDLVYRILAKSA